MHFEHEYIYHIYNRSNENLFREEENYIFFLQELRTHIVPCADILAYCLMPNHFHLMVQVNKSGVIKIDEKNRPTTQMLSKQIGLMLSSYTQAINKRFNRQGSLFSHKTKAKQLNNWGNYKRINERDYSKVCFNYIHQNPINSGLVTRISDWEYSTYKDYAGLRNGTLINKKLAITLLNLDISNFAIESLKETTAEDIRCIF
jgi:REP element-mobilizing transposase RayT